MHKPQAFFYLGVFVGYVATVTAQPLFLCLGVLVAWGIDAKFWKSQP